MISDQKVRAKRHIQRPDPALWQGLIGAATSNVCDGQGRRGALDIGIRPAGAACTFTGPALTIESRPGDNLAALKALDWVQPGDVVVLANAGGTTAALLGGNYIAMIKARGAVGIVSDGPARDLDEIDALGLPVFSRGIMPGGPFKTGPGSIGFPVSIGGVSISSGDIIIGDRDGIVVVRQEEIARAVEGFRAVAAREQDMIASIRRGEIPEFLRQRLAAVEVDYE